MSSRNTVLRTANSLSLAAWFGGSLMGLVGLPRASRDAAAGPGDDQGGPADAAAGARLEGGAWSSWQPVQAGAIASQLASSAALTLTNAHRVVGQRGVARASIARTALTGAAIGATALAARSGKQLEHALSQHTTAEHGDGANGRPGNGTDADDGTTPGAAGATVDVAGMERRTRVLQAAVPVLTGAIIAMDSLMGEQQRPSQVLRGTAQRLLPDALADRLAA